MKIGHAHLKVSDLDKAVEFYERVLGFKTSEVIPGQFAFLTGGEMHHELALQQAHPSALTASPRALGLYHIAFEVESRAELADAVSKLESYGLEVHLVDHGISLAAYTHDLDGNGLEIYLDTRESESGRQVWAGQSARAN